MIAFHPPPMSSLDGEVRDGSSHELPTMQLGSRPRLVVELLQLIDRHFMDTRLVPALPFALSLAFSIFTAGL